MSSADLIDAEGTYTTRDMFVSDLPEVWFHRDRRAGQVPTNGCIGISADHLSSSRPYSHGLLVFLAEVDDKGRAVGLAESAAAASTPDRPQVASSVDRLLAVFVGGSTTVGEKPVESVESLERFPALVRPLLVSHASA